MANVTLARTGRRWYNGPQGNLSISPVHAVTLAASIGDVITFGDEVEPNIKVVGVSLTAAALGASTTLTLKVGDVTLVNAKGTVSAVNEVIPVDDVLIPVGQLPTLTVGGGAAAGVVKFKLLYEMVGNL